MLVPRVIEGNDYDPYGGDQESHLSDERFTDRKQRLDGYLKHVVNNIKSDANFQRKEGSNFYPKFDNQQLQLYDDVRQKDNPRLNWQFTNRQRNYFDQYIPKPTRRDLLFRRKNNFYSNPSGDQKSDLSNEQFTGQKQILYGYFKYPVDNTELDAKFRRREDSRFYPIFKNLREHLYNEVQRNDDRGTKWKFMKRQRNYFDQHNVHPTRYDSLFRRNSNLHLNPNGDHRSTQYDYYNQQIDDSKPWGRSLYEKRIPYEDFLQNKNNNIPRNENGQ